MRSIATSASSSAPRSNRSVAQEMIRPQFPSRSNFQTVSIPRGAAKPLFSHSSPRLDQFEVSRPSMQRKDAQSEFLRNKLFSTCLGIFFPWGAILPTYYVGCRKRKIFEIAPKKSKGCVSESAWRTAYRDGTS
ncbi:hypothetical protein TWF225_009548 [Orbilia oligospora]|nr:hypothetical protein TWF225_009548 [Orbilia oligospora]KAF3242046.1 hypothetical protein TWF217_011861 [Orbilia oligospora]KAF3244524.1 hypothetical protein TWF128_009636 [Orbilia oligospora]